MHRLGQIEVVVEAVGDRRADRVPRAGVEVADGLREHVRGRVPQHVQTVVGLRRDRLDQRVGARDERQVAQLAVDARRDRALGQRGADRLPLGELDVRRLRAGSGSACVA